MAAEKIGKARCPLCSGTADVSLSKSGLVVLTMNCCNAQLFTRSGRSDEIVRGLILKTAPAEPEATPSGPADPAPAVQNPTPPPPVTDPEPVRKSRSPFGLLGASHD